jgi:hypothetical protein
VAIATAATQERVVIVPAPVTAHKGPSAHAFETSFPLSLQTLNHFRGFVTCRVRYPDPGPDVEWNGDTAPPTGNCGAVQSYPGTCTGGVGGGGPAAVVLAVLFLASAACLDQAPMFLEMTRLLGSTEHRARMRFLYGLQWWRRS